MVLRRLLPLLILLALLLVSASFFQPSRQAGVLLTASPTPTYDPLVEPPLPPNPTELELGQNLYWHWCMPCHGDRGQGLTDEFRLIWEPDHQDCWSRGCHGGLPRDQGFPIPTVVPALRRSDHLISFASDQQLSEYLAKTHPPQSPGILAPDQYHSIAAYVFSMNARDVESSFAAATLTPTPTHSSGILAAHAPSPLILALPVLVLIVLISLIAFHARHRNA